MCAEENFGFLRFINSKDIREYITSIGYEMNSAECAYVAFESLRSMREKHDAYREIIKSMEDIKLPEVDSSLHKALKVRIELEKILMDVFYQQDKAVYMWRTMERNDEEYRGIYAGWNTCLHNAFEWVGDDRLIWVEKRWITVGDAKEKIVRVLFNKNKEAVKVYSFGILDYDLTEKFWMIISASKYVHIPFPFKRGDIVHTITEGVFVYEPQWEKSELGGYIVDEAGNVGLYSRDCTFDMSYYKKKLKGKDKRLKDISLFLKGKMSLVEFIERCK